MLSYLSVSAVLVEITGSVHSSVAAVFPEPPKPIADVLFPPDPLPNVDLPVAKSATSVQLVPFHCSVLAVGPELRYTLAPKAIADV